MLELDLQGDNERRLVSVNNIKQFKDADLGEKVKTDTQLHEDEEQALIQIWPQNLIFSLRVQKTFSKLTLRSPATNWPMSLELAEYIKRKERW